MLFHSPRLLVLGTIFILLTACTGFHSYSVEFSDPPARLPPPPLLDFKAVLETDDFNVYRAHSSEDHLFVIPTRLELTPSHARQHQAISFERDDGEKMILIGHLSPNPDLLTNAVETLEEMGISYEEVEFYPIDTLHVRPATDPREPETIKATTVTGRPSPSAPFSVLIAIQVNQKSNIQSFKKLAESNMGYLFFAFFDLLFPEGDSVEAKTSSAQILLRNAYITNQTM